MVNGTSAEKHEHLKSVLVDFMDDRIRKVVDQLTPEVTEGLHDYTPEHDDYEPPDPSEMGHRTTNPDKSISENEIDKFIKYDIPRIDNKDYFRAIFYK